jgi:hypothetical protein
MHDIVRDRVDDRGELVDGEELQVRACVAAAPTAWSRCSRDRIGHTPVAVDREAEDTVEERDDVAD